MRDEGRESRHSGADECFSSPNRLETAREHVHLRESADNER